MDEIVKINGCALNLCNATNNYIYNVKNGGDGNHDLKRIKLLLGHMTEYASKFESIEE